MKALLTTFAVVELVSGLAMLAVPSRLGKILLGSSLGTFVELTVARIAGVALLILAVVCWVLRNEGRSRVMRRFVGAMLLYSAGEAGVVVYAGLGWGLSGIILWPSALVHISLAVWCLLALLHKPTRISATQ